MEHWTKKGDTLCPVYGLVYRDIYVGALMRQIEHLIFLCISSSIGACYGALESRRETHSLL
jgi:hypothetical protein